jgi:very-short-patch-repair endonuclease
MKGQDRIHPATKRNARELRREMTDAERLLWRHLRQRQVAGRRFRRQHPVGRFIVDFVCLEAAVVVELDGGQHADRQAYDQARTAWLEAQGFRVLRFWNNEVLANAEGVRDLIERALRGCVGPTLDDAG